MKLRLLVLVIFTLLLTLVIPATADAAGGDSWYKQKCPAGFEGPDHNNQCTKETHEKVDAEKITHYYCTPPYTGPDANNQCSKFGVEEFPATPIYDLRCPDGFDLVVNSGGSVCTKTETTIETVHVDEDSSLECPAGWVLAGTECSFAVVEITQQAPTSADEFSCPEEYAGPNATNQCTNQVLTVETVPALESTTELCPDGFTLQTSICSQAGVDTNFVGAVPEGVLTCPAETVLEQGGCVSTVPAKTIYSCEAGFTLIDTVFPFTCLMQSTQGPVTTSLECPAPLTNFIATMPGMGTCDLITTPLAVTQFTCPGNSTPVAGSDTLCEEQVDVTITVPAVVVDETSCPAGFVGPIVNLECTKTTLVEEVIDATVTTVATCPADFIGPDASGQCIQVTDGTITTPAIEVPSFTCPAGYDGPDAKWNCTKEVTTTAVVDQEEYIKGYECPADARGPNGNNLCFRDKIETIDAHEKHTYECPQNSHGMKNGHCVIKHIETVPAAGHDCKIKFYDYPHAQKKLFSIDDNGEYNLSGNLAKYNDDIESVRVPHGCSVSVAKSFNGQGWCATLGGGVHNLPDDEMSWFALPGTGCNNR